MAVINTKFVIVLLFFFCLETNGQDEAVSRGNSTVFIQWYLGDTTKPNRIHCKPEGTPAPTVQWFLNKDMALPLTEKIKPFKEGDGSISLEFESVEYDIMNAYGAVEFAEYSCVATGAGLPTNYTSFLIFVREPRSAGTVAGAVILLLLFLAFSTLIAWRLKFNDIATTL